MDISTGDKITPEKINYSFNRIFDDEKIVLNAYPIETVLAEKLETILSRNIENTRSRDFYDILALKPLAYKCDSNILKEALLNTAQKRGSTKYLENTKNMMNLIKTDSFMISRWEKYCKKQPYAEKITFEQVCSEVEDLLNRIGIR